MESLAVGRLRVRRHRRRHQPARRSRRGDADVEDAPVVRFLQKMLIDAINAARLRPALRALRIPLPRALPRRRRAARDHAAADRHQGQAGLAHQGHLAPGHRREARAARRPDEAQVRQQGDRLPRQHPADAVRREDRDPDPRPVERQARHRGARLREDREGPPAEGDRAALRHGAGHRPDRQRQDGVALHLPEHPEPAGRQHRHGRRPGRNQPARRQPGQRQRQGRPDLRRRAEVVPAPGSGHHHGRRNPRPRNRRHRASRRRRPATW